MTRLLLPKTLVLASLSLACAAALAQPKPALLNDKKAFVADLVPAALRGRAFGIYNFTVSITVLPASLLMGLLWDTAGPRYAFLVGAGLALAAMAVLAGAVRRPREAGFQGFPHFRR